MYSKEQIMFSLFISEYFLVGCLGLNKICPELCRQKKQKAHSLRGILEFHVIWLKTIFLDPVFDVIK